MLRVVGCKSRLSVICCYPLFISGGGKSFILIINGLDFRPGWHVRAFEGYSSEKPAIKKSPADRFPYGVLPTGAWFNAVTGKPGFYAVALSVMVEPINLFLVFSEIR